MGNETFGFDDRGRLILPEGTAINNLEGFTLVDESGNKIAVVRVDGAAVKIRPEGAAIIIGGWPPIKNPKCELKTSRRELLEDSGPETP